MEKLNDHKTHTIVTKDRPIAIGLTRRIDSWARQIGLADRVAWLDRDHRTVYVSNMVPRNIVQRAADHYSRIKVRYAG